jgi:hypothetical protein
MIMTDYLKKVGWRYLRMDANIRKVPDRLPSGRVLVHNHIVPSASLGLRGFRAWTQVKDRALVPCPCCWAGWNADGKLKHYRMRAGLPDGWDKLPAAELRKKLIELDKRNEKWRKDNDPGWRFLI